MNSPLDPLQLFTLLLLLLFLPTASAANKINVPDISFQDLRLFANQIRKTYTPRKVSEIQQEYAPTSEIQIIIQEIQNSIDTQSLKSQAKSPKTLLANLFVQSLNFSSAHSVYRQLRNPQNSSWYVYGVTNLKNIQLKFIYPF